MEKNKVSPPLGEVFGYPPKNLSELAEHYRNNRLCPYFNKVPSCTKDKAKDPLGVCSIYHNSDVVITCPIRFRQNWLITANAAKFFFDGRTSWTSLQEIKLRDKHGQSAGNIDVVIIAYDDDGQVTDFGSLEVQAVYISGNVRNVFKAYMKDRSLYLNTKWGGKIIRPDFLSSSRKRLLPQMLYKGGILKAWGKRQAIAIQKCFYETLPKLPSVEPKKADIAWFLYELKPNADESQLDLTLSDIIYTEFKAALDQIAIAEPGDVSNFMGVLQKKFNEENNNENPPDAPTLIEDIVK